MSRELLNTTPTFAKRLGYFFTKDLTDCSTVVCELQAIYHSSVVLIVRVQHTSL